MNQTEEAVRRFLGAYNAHDLEALDEVFTSDAIYDDKGIGRRSDGKEAILEYMGLAFEAAPDCRWELKSIIASGDRAAFEGIWTGTVSRGGSEPGEGEMAVRLDAATMIDVRDGLISSIVDYHNFPSGG